MKLLERVNRLFDHLAIAPRDERPLDFHLTAEDIEDELHIPHPFEAERPARQEVASGR